MAVDPKLKEAIEKKLGVSGRHADRLISERAAAMVLSREQAAMSLAGESGIGLAKFATDADLATIRAAKLGVASGPRASAAPAPAALPATRRTRSATTRTVTEKRVPAKPPARKATSPKKIFVVHGRDEARRKAMFAFLRSIGLNPIEWSKGVKDTGSASPYNGQVVDTMLSQAVAVVVLLTPDDLAYLRDDLIKPSDEDFESKATPQARPNVLFEAGMAFGYRPDHTIIVQFGKLRPFSDIAGRNIIHMDDSAKQRSELASRLGSAGADVDTSGSDWYTEGDFS